MIKVPKLSITETRPVDECLHMDFQAVLSGGEKFRVLVPELLDGSKQESEVREVLGSNDNKAGQSK